MTFSKLAAVAPDIPKIATPVPGAALSALHPGILCLKDGGHLGHLHLLGDEVLDELHLGSLGHEVGNVRVGDAALARLLPHLSREVLEEELSCAGDEEAGLPRDHFDVSLGLDDLPHPRKRQNQPPIALGLPPLPRRNVHVG
eukprot:CAMPEP_0182906412 /NCGR_PEP_ID=MMETSP0034_2-20130328/33714_1 /TAXON_ID=156128 /ORGANISM="Nephroselmis pyriformis, Strain CCMP717" /LENGTH=141 /DNA_ID=CAMNT_0025042077 /DNA_START=56 /DNA_END=478 /DNA_ORIENTATION=+